MADHLTSKQLKERAGWRPSADRCKNCVSFKPSVFSQPPMVPGAPGLRGRPALCDLNKFVTSANAVCDDYQRKGTRVNDSE